ncbi:MAG: hypothetical protein AB8H79_04925 [Myxococcota bacterium]
MYRCEACKKNVAAGTPRVTVVLETRKKVYDVTPQASDKERKKARRRGYNIDREQQYATGWEISREAALCPECAASWAAQHPEGVAPTVDDSTPVDADAPVAVAEVGPEA